MRTVLYPGSFDPITLGHLDVIRRASARFERVVVGVLHNPQKRGALDIETRIRCIREATKDFPNVEAKAFSGLLTQAARDCGADAVLRGLRNASDFDFEAQMARLNLSVGGVETIFLVASPEVSHISASMAREIASFGGDVGALVPEIARECLRRAYQP